MRTVPRYRNERLLIQSFSAGVAESHHANIQLRNDDNRWNRGKATTDRSASVQSTHQRTMQHRTVSFTTLSMSCIVTTPQFAGTGTDAAFWNEPLVVPTDRFKFRMEPWISPLAPDAEHSVLLVENASVGDG